MHAVNNGEAASNDDLNKHINNVGYSAEGGAVGGGCSWRGVVLYSKTAYNRM